MISWSVMRPLIGAGMILLNGPWAMLAQTGINSGKVKIQDLPVSSEVAKALAQRKQGNAADAATLLHEAVRKQPDDYLAQYNLGITLGETGDFKAATQAFDRALTLKESRNIDDPTIYNSAGWANLLARDYPKAETLLKRGEAQSSTMTETSKKRLLNNLGLLYLYQGEPTKAQPYLNKAKDLGSTLAVENLKLTDKIIEIKPK